MKVNFTVMQMILTVDSQMPPKCGAGLGMNFHRMRSKTLKCDSGSSNIEPFLGVHVLEIGAMVAPYQSRFATASNETSQGSYKGISA